MKIKKSKIKGVCLIIPSLFIDNRGYFFESFNKKKLEDIIGYPLNFVQDNQSQSTYGVMRGLHLQTGESAQAKLVRAIEGEILDVIVDLRKDSDSFGQYASFLLCNEKKHQLFIPKGIAHGFIVLSKKATIHYKTDNYYSPKTESGIIYNDEDLKIKWSIPQNKIIVSKKDLLLPTLKEFNKKHE